MQDPSIHRVSNGTCHRGRTKQRTPPNEAPSVHGVSGRENIGSYWPACSLAFAGTETFEGAPAWGGDSLVVGQLLRPNHAMHIRLHELLVAGHGVNHLCRIPCSIGGGGLRYLNEIDFVESLERFGFDDV
jgi:hypothetical protein